MDQVARKQGLPNQCSSNEESSMVCHTVKLEAELADVGCMSCLFHQCPICLMGSLGL